MNDRQPIVTPFPGNERLVISTHYPDTVFRRDTGVGTELPHLVTDTQNELARLEHYGIEHCGVRLLTDEERQHIQEHFGDVELASKLVVDTARLPDILASDPSDAEVDSIVTCVGGIAHYLQDSVQDGTPVLGDTYMMNGQINDDVIFGRFSTDNPSTSRRPILVDMDPAVTNFSGARTGDNPHAQYQAADYVSILYTSLRRLEDAYGEPFLDQTRQTLIAIVESLEPGKQPIPTYRRVIARLLYAMETQIEMPYLDTVIDEER